jgi:hypothetical protein
MAKPDKAAITYATSETTTGTLRFHSVLAEEHQVTAEVTKYPTQSRTMVTNHSIRKNRVITIKALVSDFPMAGQIEGQSSYSTESTIKNSRAVYQELSRLIREGVPCTVMTNFGEYSPVLFTKLKTATKEGVSDMLDFVLVGEEIQIGDGVNSTTPTEIKFTEVPAANKQAEYDNLKKLGYDPPPIDSVSISKGEVNHNSDYSMQTTGTTGKPNKVTMRTDGGSVEDKSITHKQSTNEWKFYETAAPGGNINYMVLALDEEDALASFEEITLTSTFLGDGILDSIPGGESFKAGAMTASACLQNAAIGLVNDLVDDAINTAFGVLSSFLNDAVMGIVKAVEGNPLLQIGLDCFIAGAYGAAGVLDEDDFQDNQLYNEDDIMKKARAKGRQTEMNALRPAAPMTITKVSAKKGSLFGFGG